MSLTLHQAPTDGPQGPWPMTAAERKAVMWAAHSILSPPIRGRGPLAGLVFWWKTQRRHAALVAGSSALNGAKERLAIPDEVIIDADTDTDLWVRRRS